MLEIPKTTDLTVDLHGWLSILGAWWINRPAPWADAMEYSHTRVFGGRPMASGTATAGMRPGVPRRGPGPHLIPQIGRTSGRLALSARSPRGPDTVEPRRSVGQPGHMNFRAEVEFVQSLRPMTSPSGFPNDAAYESRSAGALSMISTHCSTLG